MLFVRSSDRVERPAMLLVHDNCVDGLGSMPRFRMNDLLPAGVMRTMVDPPLQLYNNQVEPAMFRTGARI